MLVQNTYICSVVVGLYLSPELRFVCGCNTLGIALIVSQYTTYSKPRSCSRTLHVHTYTENGFTNYDMYVVGYIRVLCVPVIRDGVTTTCLIQVVILRGKCITCYFSLFSFITT